MAAWRCRIESQYMNKKRVVITGIGVISPIGIGKEEYWKTLSEGRSGFKPITLFDTSDLKVKIAGEITEFDPKQFFDEISLINLDRATTLLSSSTKLALEDGKIEITEKNTHQIGVSIGATFGSLRSLSEFDKESLRKGPQLVNPSRFPNTVANSPASRLSIRFKIKGFNTTVSTGMCAGIDAIDYAVKSIRFHNRKTIVVGAVEEMCEQEFLGYYKLNYLSGLEDNTESTSCPFDKRRNGIIFSEGAGVVILEDLEEALKKKSAIYAEILSVASTFEPYRLHKYSPKGKGMAEAMRLALERANIKPEDIDYICANANSTQDADLIETQAIKEVFGDYAKKIPVSSIKSMIGETYSASGSLATIASIGAINQGFVPPTTNYKQKDPRLDLDYVPNRARKIKVDTVMINSFGQNGANSVLIIRRYE